MLNETLFRKPRTAGLQTLQARGEAGARELTTRRLVLEAGGASEFSSKDEETIVVLQQGRGAFTAGDMSWPVARAGVFEERATALYLPSGTRLQVKAERPLEAVLISTPA